MNELPRAQVINYSRHTKLKWDEDELEELKDEPSRFEMYQRGDRFSMQTKGRSIDVNRNSKRSAMYEAKPQDSKRSTVDQNGDFLDSYF